MPRIFKFSKFALKLFVPHASELTDMKIYIYTDNFDIAYVVTSGFKINVNEVGLVVPQNAVNNMSDGIINYRIEGYLNGEFYMEQRQSNYYLKTPSFEIEDETIIAVSTEFVDEGNYKMIIKASEYNVDGLSQVEIDATTFAEEKYEEGNVAGFETGKQIQKELMEPITITENGTYSREDGYNEITVAVPDLNGDYQTGYDAGYVDGEYRGFNNGYTAGETDQKDKLESISITENGTYTREDGYNEVIVNVEQEGGGVNPDTLREITITKNGTYTSKYSELIKTGEFEDETLFYGFGRIDGAVYDTQINLNEVGTLESLEFWHKSDGADESGMYYEREILSSNSEVMPNEGSIEFRYEFDVLVVQIGYAQEYLQLDEGVWHHFKLSKTGDDTCTLFVDDEEKYSFPLPTATSTNFYINGVAYDEGLTRNANGYFGLININGHIIIPTENGFMNYTTQTILPTLKEGSYTYGNYVDEGEPYKTINVDIPLQAKYEWYGDTAEDFTILPDEGYGGMSKVDVNISTALSTKYDEGFEQGKNSIINSLQTLNVTSNGTYTPPITPFLRLDGNDKYEMFYPSESNAFEIKFRNSYGEFFTQKSNNPNFISLRADTSISVLIIKWFNKEIKISDVDFSKWHTLVVKMGDENARVIFDGQVYNDYTQNSSYKNNGNAVNIYRNIDLEHFTFWNTWEDYNNGVTPHFDFKASPEGLMKNQQGGEYSVVNNIGGGSAQYIEEKETEGWNEVIVDVPQNGGSGDYETGFEDGVAAQKAKLTNITITNNGTYTNEDGYGEVIVNVEGGSGGDCEEAYEQGKADQKALMTTATFTSEGTYTREDGWNEVKFNLAIFPFMKYTVLREFSGEWDRYTADGEFWAGNMFDYEQNNPDATSNGMMYEIDYDSPVGYYYDWKILNTGGYGITIWGKKSLVTPWVYNANNSPSTRIILPDYFLGGFECSEVEYINRVFEGAESLKAIVTLTNLGKSFTSVNTLDLSVLTNLNDDYYDGDCFILLANSVYDFAVDGMNVNGISYSNVKLPTTVSQEAIDAWIAKGWRVLQ